MNAVMISIRPEWCELISGRKKRIELRKTRPRIDTPFKCYIYETRGSTNTPWADEDGHLIWKGRGAVIGEFICESIYRVDVPFPAYQADMDKRTRTLMADACLTYTQAHDYLGHRTGWGWLISDLKIYDEPKAISEFKRRNRTEENAPCAHTKWLYEPCETCRECNLKRPPQSWCYVEELT